MFAYISSLSFISRIDVAIIDCLLHNISMNRMVEEIGLSPQIRENNDENISKKKRISQTFVRYEYSN